VDIGSESIYLVRSHPKVKNEDLSELPKELREDFEDIKFLLSVDPYSCSGLISSHELLWKLEGCRALEIKHCGEAYRLVYRVYELPENDKKVEILSFAIHDPAYDRAKVRIGLTSSRRFGLNFYRR
jgi:hypothetical protein